MKVRDRDRDRQRPVGRERETEARGRDEWRPREKIEEQKCCYFNKEVARM